MFGWKLIVYVMFGQLFSCKMLMTKVLKVRVVEETKVELFIGV